jgi:uncharacterized protein YndB with AHSA1/START domain
MTSQIESGKVGSNELLLVRTFNAPVSLVFSIWADAEHMKRWLGPHEFTCTSCEMDFRPGGKWRAGIESVAYGVSFMGGVYREIEKDKRIVYTFAWEDGRDQPGVETIVTVTFSEQDGRTVQTFHQAPFIHEEARNSHVGGWSQVFEKEDVYLQDLRKGERS